MAALVASRANPVQRARYQALLLRGKPKKVALVALMRQLIVHMNFLLKEPQLALAN
jgi:transposase